MPGFWIRLLVSALGLWIASALVSGVTFSGIGTLALASLFLGVANAVVRPILIILTFPITVVTLGLFLLVINAAMVSLVAALLPGFGLSGFGAAILTSIIVSITAWIASWYIGPRGSIEIVVVRER